MSCYFTTVVRCSNPDAIKGCVLALRKKDVEQCEEWKDGDKGISVCINYYTPYEEIEQVSKNFPDDVIDCETICECTPGDEFTYEFRNGEYKHLSLRPVYYITPMNLGNKKDEAGIFEKAATLFRRLDTLVPEPDGGMRIDWVVEEICYKFSYDGADGNKYKVEATKEQGYIIEFKVYEDLGKDDWREITGAEDTSFIKPRIEYVDLTEAGGFQIKVAALSIT